MIYLVKRFRVVKVDNICVRIMEKVFQDVVDVGQQLS